MSLSYVFELAGKPASAHLKESIQDICGDKFKADFLKVGEFTHVFLDYAFGEDTEIPIILNVVKYLQREYGAEFVHYIRCYDAYDESVSVHGDRLSPEKIFSKEFFPVMSIQDKGNYKFLLSTI